jgi:hypothetical protein
MLLLGKNFCVGVEGRGVSTGVLSVAVLATRPGLRYSSATITTSFPPIADDRFRISSFSSYEMKMFEFYAKYFFMSCN